jgi:hypothetical protein
MSCNSNDSAAGAPKYKINANSAATGTDLFGTQVVGLDDGEVQNSTKANHTGWTRVQRGTGPVATIAINAAGTGYANGNFVRVSGGTTNAYATITTNGSGAITALTLNESGAGFVNNSTITTGVFTVGSTGGAAGAGTTATFTITLGGRANRVQTETLVALSGMTANNSTLAG